MKSEQLCVILPPKPVSKGVGNVDDAVDVWATIPEVPDAVSELFVGDGLVAVEIIELDDDFASASACSSPTWRAFKRSWEFWFGRSRERRCAAARSSSSVARVQACGLGSTLGGGRGSTRMVPVLARRASDSWKVSDMGDSSTSTIDSAM